MEIEQEAGAVVGRKTFESIGNGLRIAVGRMAVGHVQDRGRIGGRVRIAPLLQDPDRRIESGAHRRLAVAARLEPDGKSHRLLHHIAVRSGDLLGAGLDPQGSFGEARDGVQCLAVQRSLKAVASLLPAIGDHPHVKVVADAFGLGAAGNERVECLIEHIRQKGGLALSAFQPMIHRRGLVHHHHDGGRRRAADFCLVTQGSPPRVAATATCNNGDLHAANGLNAVRCSARQATRFPHRSSTCSRPFVIFCKARDKARDMQHFCDRDAASYHK